MAPTHTFPQDSLEAASDMWRQPLACRARKRVVPHIHIDMMNDQLNSGFANCGALRKSDDSFAIGGALGKSQAQLIHIKHSQKTGKFAFEDIGQVSLPKDPWRLAFLSDSTLLAGCVDGSVQVIHVASDRNSGESLDVIQSLSAPGLPKGGPPPTDFLAAWPTSRRIRSILCASESNSIVATLESCSIHLWDVKTATRIGSQAASGAPVLCGGFHPQHPHIVACSGVSATIKILDVRNMKGSSGSAIVLKQQRDIHRGAVLDLQWSPFVPFWYATSSEDGNVHVWDLRSQKMPVSVLKQSTNAVSVLAWDQQHPELLAAGGVDAGLSLYHLGIGPHYVAASNLSKSSEELVSLVSSTNAHVYYSLQSDGALSAVCLEDAFLSDLVPTKEWKDTPGISKYELQKMEKAFYLRQYPQGYKLACELMEKSVRDGAVDVALEILEALDTRKLSWDFILPVREKTAVGELPDDPSSASGVRFRSSTGNDSNAAQCNAPLLSFADDVKTWSSFLPPNFEGWSSQIPAAQLQQMELLKLELRLKARIQRGDLDGIREMAAVVKHVYTGMTSENPVRLDMAVIGQLIQALLGYDMGEGYELAEFIGHTLEKVHLFEEFVPIVQIVLAPTIYEGKYETRQESVFRLGSHVLREIGFLKGIATAAKISTAAYTEAVLNIEEAANGVGSPTAAGRTSLAGNLCSVTACWSVLNGYLHLEKYDPLYVYATSLIELVEGSEFAFAVSEFLSDVVYLRFEAYLNDALECEPCATDRYLIEEAVVCVTNIAQKAKSLPADVQDLLPSVLAKLTENLELALDDQTSHEDEVAAAALKILGDITQSRKGVVSQWLEAEITECMEMLRSFT